MNFVKREDVFYKDGLIYAYINTKNNAGTGTGRTAITLTNYRATRTCFCPMTAYGGFYGECYIQQGSNIITYNASSANANGKAMLIFPVEPIS